MKYNIRALFSRKYRLVQVGLIDWELYQEDRKILDFEAKYENAVLEDIYYGLERELKYHISNIEENDEDYFYDMTEEEQLFKKTFFLKELKDIYDWLI
jgi:hypothetical protein